MKSAMLVAVAALAAGCSRRSDQAPSSVPPKPAADPWAVKLKAYEEEYAQNQEKLRADWQSALRDVAAGEGDADRLIGDIDRLTVEVQRNRDVLHSWDQEIVAELGRRSAR
jgi:hypothetical protein